MKRLVVLPAARLISIPSLANGPSPWIMEKGDCVQAAAWLRRPLASEQETAGKPGLALGLIRGDVSAAVSQSGSGRDRSIKLLSRTADTPRISNPEAPGDGVGRILEGTGRILSKLSAIASSWERMGRIFLRSSV
jgi:hypothetical protein